MKDVWYPMAVKRDNMTVAERYATALPELFYPIHMYVPGAVTDLSTSVEHDRVITKIGLADLAGR